MGLAHLPYAKELETLTLGKTATTDVGLRHLESLGRLKLLILQGCAVTDRGMASLGKLSELEDLDLRYTRVSDAGIAQLAGLFIETPLSDVLQYASEYSKLKFVIHEDVAKKLPVTLNIRGLTTATTLEILLNNLDLHGLIRDDSIYIHPGPLPQDSP